MFSSRTATGLTIAVLALPATATATPIIDHSGGGGSRSEAYSDYYGWGAVPFNADPGHQTLTSSRAGTTSQDLRTPDAADAARAGDIANAMEHYQRSLPIPAAVQPASAPDGVLRPASPSDETPAWPEIAFAGVVLLVTAGGVVRVRLRRRHRVAA